MQLKQYFLKIVCFVLCDFLNFIFNRMIIALQCCVSFCYITTWIIHKYTYIPSLLNLLPTHPHTTPLGCHRAPGWAPGEKTAFKGSLYDNSESLSRWIHVASWISLGNLLLQQSCPASALLITATYRAVRIKGRGPCAWSPRPGGSWDEPQHCIWNTDYRLGILHVVSPLILSITLLLFSCSIMSDSLWPYGL